MQLSGRVGDRRSASLALHPIRAFRNMASDISGSAQAADLHLRYAESFACLLAAQAGRKPALAQVHGRRLRDLQEASGTQTVSQPQCGRCGLLALPGWTGHTTIASLNDRKLGRRFTKRGSSERVQNDKKLLWTCQCGWQSIAPGPDQASKRTFKKRKITDRIERSSPVVAAPPTEHTATLASSIVDPSAVPAMTSPLLSSKARSEGPAVLPSPKTSTATSSRQATPNDQSAAPKASEVVASRRSRPNSPEAFLPANKPPAGQTSKTPSPALTLQTVPPSKKKRSKREGLQAMLAAKKELEAKQNKAGGSGLGLSSFLQGL